jgi:ABC-type lipoprotein release transport system permease subunit
MGAMLQDLRYDLVATHTLIAWWIPGRRASRVDPIIALREE